MIFAAKIRISKNNTKQKKPFFVFILNIFRLLLDSTGYYFHELFGKSCFSF